MKWIHGMILLLTASMATAEEAADVPAAKPVFFFQPMAEKNQHMMIYQAGSREKDGSFLLGVEPGCILLKVRIEEHSDKTCRFKIISSPAGAAMVEMAKNKLGIKSDSFEVSYSVMKQDLAGQPLPPSNQITKITDSGGEPAAPSAGDKPSK